MLVVEATNKLASGVSLSRSESKEVIGEIIRGGLPKQQVASFLRTMRNPSSEEILGAVEAARAYTLKMVFGEIGDILDIVGTGGDHKNSFNFSTAASFVAAGAGCIIAKHGNRGFSGRNGSADVMEKLGVNILVEPKKNAEILERIGIAFVFAPLYNQALGKVSEIRRELGISTIFNVIGPLTSPACPSTYLLGAYNGELAGELAKALAALNIKKAIVACGAGYDELSLVGENIALEVKGKHISRKPIDIYGLGLRACLAEDLAVSSISESASAIVHVMEGERGPRRDMVLLNAGAAIYANMKAESIKEGVRMARDSIDYGSAMNKLVELRRHSSGPK